MKLANVVSMSSATVCEIAATVPTGLEPGAAEECREVLGREARIQRGRIAFDLLSVEELTKVRCESVHEISGFFLRYLRCLFSKGGPSSVYRQLLCNGETPTRIL